MKNKEIIFESRDKYNVNIPNKYVLVGNKNRKSIFLQDIGIHSKGFAKIFGLAMILSIGTIVYLYFLFRI